MTELEKKYFKKLFTPLLVLIVLLLLQPVWAHFFQNPEFSALSHRLAVPKLWQVLILLMITWQIVRLIDFLIWQRIIEHRVGGKVPRLLKTMANLVLFFITIIIIIAFIFERSVTGILATTGFVGIVIGLGMRNIIENAFIGIALSLDPIIRIGDWITVGIQIKDPGVVVDITYRNTSVLTQENNIITIPNSLITTSAITNYSRPNNDSFLSLSFIVLVGEVPISRIKRILEVALRRSELIIKEPLPCVRVGNISAGAVQFDLQFYFNYSQAIPLQIKDEIYTSIINDFEIVGISMDITAVRPPFKDDTKKPKEINLVLSKIDLFTDLANKEITKIATGAREFTVTANSVIFEQGEQGDSMFIIVEGLFEVKMKTKKGLIINRLFPGQYFGEMSLLIGTSRSATVIALTDGMLIEIKKKTISTILRDHPQVNETFSNVIAARQVMNLQKKEALEETQLDEATKSYSQKFKKLMMKWFGH